MIDDFGLDDSLLIIGSTSNTGSLRYLFSYCERRQLIKKLFPQLKIVGLADFFNLKEWLAALDDLLSVAFPLKSKEDFIFLTGSDEDVNYLVGHGYQTKSFDRQLRGDISATEVRRRLVEGLDLDGLINPLIIDDLKTFADKKLP
jgi:hypothetical protein